MVKEQACFERALLVGLLIVLTAAGVMSGCETSASVSLPMAPKYPKMIYQHFDYPPERVLTATQESLRRLKLRPTESKMTGIDGRFEVQTALGRQMQINVVGTSRTTAKVEVEYMKDNDRESAKIILQEIGARL